jgi:hypothetical protein
MGKGSSSALLPILAGVGIGVATGNPLIGMAVAQGGGALMSGMADSAAAKQQGENAKLAGEQRANEIRRQLMSTLGNQEAMLASRGVLGRGGTPETLARETTRAFNDDLRINRLNTRNTAAEANLASGAAMTSGILGAGMAGMNAWQSISSLGQTPQSDPFRGKAPTPRAKPGLRNPRPLVIRR